MKINKRKELQNITINHSADIDYKDFIEDLQRMHKKTYSFLTIDAMLLSKRSSKIFKKIVFIL